MLAEHEMTLEDMHKAADNGYVCVVCQERVSVAWGGSYGVNSYVLKCSNKEHTGITRHDKAEENKKKEYFSMHSAALQVMPENQMLARIDLARFPQELTPADKRLLAQVAITYGFDPLMGEVSIYQGRPYVSIDGRYRAAQETGKLDGVSSRPATKKEREEWEVPEGDYFFRAEVMVTGANYPFVGWGRVFKSETIGGKGFKPVEKNPQRMAEKRAEAQALRKAFHIPLPSIEDIGAPEEEPTVRVIDVTTGEVTEKVTEPPPPAPPAKSEGVKEGSGSPVPESPIDLMWLRESLSSLQWTPKDFAQYLQRKYGKSKVVELSKEQAGEVVAEVQDRLNMK